MKASIPAGHRRGVAVLGVSEVILPLAGPGLATAAILVFISVWNEFLLSVTLTTSPGSS